MKAFDNYARHLAVLHGAHAQDLSNEFIVSGIIDKFFLQFELGWKLLKAFLKEDGVSVAITGSPREIIKASYRYYPCIDEEVWLSMLSRRNSLVHEYNADAARALVDVILCAYIPAFETLYEYARAR